MTTQTLLYIFHPDVKKILIDQAENKQLEKKIGIPGPTRLTITEAAYLMDRVRSAAPGIAKQIARHPGLTGGEMQNCPHCGRTHTGPGCPYQGAPEQ